MFKQLLPNKYKKIGWGILILSLPFAIASKYIGFSPDQTDDIASIIALIGFALIIGSLEKAEDERIRLCRYKSLAIAFGTFILGIFISKVFHLFDVLYYLAPYPNPEHHAWNLFESPLGLLYFSAMFYFMMFRYYKGEE